MGKMTVSELANKVGLCRQSIVMAIGAGRLKAEIEKFRYVISWDDWLEYEKSKYKRDKNYLEGEISVNTAAKLMNKDTQQVYYMIRQGNLPYEKRGGIIILRQENI